MTQLGYAALLTIAALAADAESVPINQRQARTSPEWITGGVMYQIQPRAFTPEGDTSRGHGTVAQGG